MHGNTVSLREAEAMKLADLGEDTLADLAEPGIHCLIWHSGHVASAYRYGRSYWCNGCGDTTARSEFKVLPVPGTRWSVRLWNADTTEDLRVTVWGASVNGAADEAVRAAGQHGGGEWVAMSVTEL